MRAIGTTECAIFSQIRQELIEFRPELRKAVGEGRKITIVLCLDKDASQDLRIVDIGQ
jgi:hypothetical protein